MELWDLYDENGKLVQRGHPSDQPIPSGLYHLSIEVWPFDGQRFFLTRRAAEKSRYPGYWECIGGSALSGEDHIAAAIREVKEELGVCFPAKSFSVLAVETLDTHIVAVFLLMLGKEEHFSLSEREITEGRWYSLQEMESLHLDTDFVPHQFSRYLKYVRKATFSSILERKPSSVKRLLSTHEELRVPKRGLPNSGRRPDGKPFHGMLKTINDAFGVYGDALYAKRTVLPESINNSLGGGSPLLFPPFPPAVNAIEQILQTTELSQYPFPAGDLNCRRTICAYLHQTGFSKKTTPENIILTESTTHAFHLILKMIIQPGDVILFTAPSYGLFAFEPERLGGNTRFLPLSADDNWLVDPQKLSKTIKNINKELMQQCRSDHPPRVAAFFQENPHNPTGKVMGPCHEALVKEIASVCREHGALLIDDLLYRDLCFDRDNLAIPAAHFDEEFQNVISVLGLSKAYGMAGIRAGFIVADEVLIRGLRDSIFQTIDSASHLSAVALAATFNDLPSRSAAYQTYFSELMDRYAFNLNLVIAAVEGISAVTSPYRQQVKDFVQSCCPSQEAAGLLLEGIPGVYFVPGSMPESGFFCLLDFTAYRGMRYEDTVIEDDKSLLIYLFSRYRVNFITGSAIGWPDPDRIIARISYSYEPEKIVRVFLYMKQELALLTRPFTERGEP